MKKILVLAALLTSGCSGMSVWGNSPAPRVEVAPLGVAQHVAPASTDVSTM